MKRIVLLLVEVLLLAGLVFCAGAEQPEKYTDAASGLVYYTETDEDGNLYAVIDRNEVSGREILEIPETVDGIPVRKIGEAAFGWQRGLQKVSIPEGVTEIGEQAFYQCYELTEVSLPSTLKKIGAGAFTEISAPHIDLPEGTEVPEYEPWFYAPGTWDDSESFEYGILPDGTAAIVNFMNPKNGEISFPAEIGDLPVTAIASPEVNREVKKVTVPEGVRVLGRQLFSSAKNLTEVNLPDSVEYIGEGCFGYCDHLTQFRYPAGLREIGKGAFAFTPVMNAELPAGVRRIEERAFSCSKIDHLFLPEGLEYIGPEAFEFHRLQFICIPASVREIGDGAFYSGGESTLREVLIASADVKLGNGVFGYKESRKKKTDLYAAKTNVDPEELRLYCYRDSTADRLYTFHVSKDYGMDAALRAMEAGEFGIRTSADGSIEFMASSGGAVLTRYPIRNGAIRIPDEVDGIPVTAVRRMPNLTEAELKSVRSVVLGKNVRTVEKGAFERMENLSSVSLPESLTEIQEKAFYGCRALRQVRLPSALETIGERAFANAEIHALSLPASVRTVGKEAFYWCEIRTLQLAEGLEEIGESAFWPCKADTLVIPASVKRIGRKAFGPNGSPVLRKLTFRSAETVLDSDAFGECYTHELNYPIPEVRLECLPGSTADRYFIFDAVKAYQKWGPEHVLTLPADPVLSADALPAETVIYELILPEGVEEIADGTFDGLATLAKITLPDSLRRIGARAFAETALSEVKLPAGVVEIGGSAFRECLNLKTVTMARGEPEIGASAFRGCIRLERFQLPEGTTAIGGSAFEGCTGLRSMKIPNSVTSLGVGVFHKCEGLQSLTLPEGLSEIPDLLCFFCRGLRSVNIPKQVKRIGKMAFGSCRLLTGVTLPEGLEIIDDGAFQQFVGGAQMGYHATKGRETYTRMTSLKIPSSVKYIGEQAFIACDALTSVTFAKNSSLETVGNAAFAACTHLREIRLPDSVKKIGDEVFNSCMKLQKADLGGSLTEAGKEMFTNDEALAQLTVPDTLAAIGENFLGDIGEKLTVTCGKDSAMDLWLRENRPDVKVKYTK